MGHQREEKMVKQILMSLQLMLAKVLILHLTIRLLLEVGTVVLVIKIIDCAEKAEMEVRVEVVRVIVGGNFQIAPANRNQDREIWVVMVLAHGMVLVVEELVNPVEDLRRQQEEHMVEKVKNLIY
jgi:hypothetical protein